MLLQGVDPGQQLIQVQALEAFRQLLNSGERQDGKDRCSDQQEGKQNGKEFHGREGYGTRRLEHT